MNYSFSKLVEYFEKLPGIGPRQARRFVYHLLGNEDANLQEFAGLILNLKREVLRCKNCQRFFQISQNRNDTKTIDTCDICNSSQRDKKLLLVVEKDADLNNIEKAKIYNGFYFVLGGLVPPLGAALPPELKMKEFFEKVKQDTAPNGLKEIVLAFSATPEGENTARYSEKILEPFVKKRVIKISRLGRGLSTGTELEYSDKDTIENAFKNRQ